MKKTIVPMLVIFCCLFIMPLNAQGVWHKLGTVLEPTTADLHGGVFFSGTSNSSAMYDTNCQLISPNADGKCFKIWFMGGNDLFYAEANDGAHFTRRSTAVKTNFGVSKVIKDGSTYYLYGASSPTTPPAALDAYTSSDGITFTLAKSGALVIGGVGKWDHSNVYYMTPFYKDGGNVWHATYSSGVFGSNSQTGVATSTDLLNWTNAPNFSVDNMGGPEGHVIGGVFYISAGTVPAGHTGLPADIARSTSTDLITWGPILTTLPRSQTNEGVGNNAAEGMGVNNLVEAGGNTYLYYSGTNTGNGTGYTVMGAVAHMSLTTLVAGTEGMVAAGIPPTIFLQTVTDNFTRANESPLTNAGNWTAVSSTSAINLVSNNAVGTSTINIGCVAWTGNAWPNDQWSQVTIGAGFTTTSFVEVDVRSLTAANTKYRVFVTPTAYTITKVIAGSSTTLKTAAGVFAAGDVLKISAIGSVINFYQNGSLVDTASDSSITAGSPGFGLADTATASNAKATLWSGGTVGARNVQAPYRVP